MATFEAFRDGGGSVEVRIVKATRSFYQRHDKQLPSSIVVNKSELDAARAACEALALEVVVNGCSGTLVPEVWLEVAG